MPASQPSSTSAVNHLKSCMLFQCPPYWGGFHLSRWVILERYCSRCEENLLTFRAQVVVRQRVVVMDVVGAMWIAEPCHGEPSNSHCGSKEWNTRGKHFSHYEYAKDQRMFWIVIISYGKYTMGYTSVYHQQSGDSLLCIFFEVHILHFILHFLDIFAKTIFPA
jgi:hypothetical protein